MAYFENNKKVIDAEIVKAIMDTHFDPKHLNRDGYNMLHYAGFRPTPPEVWEILIEAGCDVNHTLPKPEYDSEDEEGRDIVSFYIR